MSHRSLALVLHTLLFLVVWSSSLWEPVVALTTSLPAHARGGYVYAAMLHESDPVRFTAPTPLASQFLAGPSQLHQRLSQAEVQSLVATLRSPKRRGASSQEEESPLPRWHDAAQSPNYTVNTFQQRVNHFDELESNRIGVSSRTFAQRWWVDHHAWDGTGPIILYLNGEGPAHSSPTGAVMEYGEARHALLLSLEHRYYGESLPAPLTDRDTLRQLTIENVLADVKAFKDHVVEHVLERVIPSHARPLSSLSLSPPWLVVGGSYSGALSVWVRQAYPDDFAAAWSSSGVVNAIFDFTAFDAHIQRVVSRSCAEALRAIFHAFSRAYDETDGEGRRALFAELGVPEYFSKGDVAWMMADGAAMAVQYGHKDFLCSAVQPLPRTHPWGPMLRAFAVLWGSDFTASCYYGTECLSNAKHSAQWEASYAWVYQCCTQLAYWQTSYPSSIRLPEVNTTYFMHQCRRAFGGHVMPDTFAFNERYGGAHPRTDHVVALHGSDDPWLPAGVTETVSPAYPVLTAQCNGCGHCGDLHGSRREDPAPLVAQRAALAQYLDSWLHVVTP